ncbi:MAG: histidine triad nucleotide-binding protein [Elusimicrobia bacterium]|nr:histidine triad nucleotide-binding protein [Elusimicrobiota bacterium]
MGGPCLFCKIVSGELPTQKVYEDADTVAFKDINPQAPTHLLVIPKKHISALSTAEDADVALLGHLQKVARDLAKQGGLEAGFRLVTNNGRGAGQSVDHLHYHLLGGRRMTWPPG